MNALKSLKSLISLISALTFLFVACNFDNPSGGGTDVGNPGISGTIVSSEGKPIQNALVVIGTIEKDSICDSIYTRDDGRFQSKKLPLGHYAVTGQAKSLLGMALVVHDSVKNDPLVITLDKPAKIKLESDSLSIDPSQKIISAQIAGTKFRFSNLGANAFTLSNVPPGEMNIKVTTHNGAIHTLLNYRAISACEAYIIVDPALPAEQWITGGCGMRDPVGQPSIIWVSPPPRSAGTIARINKNATYDIAIQFSHPMNTRNTTLAVTGWSSDTSLRVINKSWIGSDVLYLKFNGPGSFTNPSYRYPLGATYFISIDTTAESAFGVPISKRYSFSFRPEPYPRLVSVEGFRFKVASEYEVVDSLPPMISLGDSVSPSVSQLSGNVLNLTFVGTPLAPYTGIHCYQSDSIPVPGMQFTQSESRLSLRFPSLMKSGSNYRIVIDSTLRFKEGLTLPYAQVIKWKTLQFTLDNARILLQINDPDATKTISLISNSVTSLYSTSPELREYTSNLPPTTWYASAPIDTASLKKNLILPLPFDTLPIIAEGTKFGFFPNRWLPPASTFKFEILPGLRSSAGDSLGVSRTYSATTDSFKLQEQHVFNLIPLGQGFDNTPLQDTLYDLKTSQVSGVSISTIGCAPLYYSAWVNFNAPLENLSAEKLTISPSDGFSLKQVRTGFGLFSDAMLIPDTTYTVKLQKGVLDTFGNSSQKSFAYRFRTEKFKLKIGNLFGILFGYQKEVAQLPPQLLPEIKILNQGVKAPGPYIISIGDLSYRSISNSMGWPPLQGIEVWNFGQTPVGSAAFLLESEFNVNQNYLYFSGTLDSTRFRDHVHIIPDDGSILLKTERNKLQFSASLSCRAKTSYSITVDKGFSDIYGHELGDSITVGFTTPAFSVDNVTLNSHAIGRDSIKMGIALPRQPLKNFHFASVFNYPINISSLESNLKIEPRMAGTLIASRTKGEFFASQLLLSDTLYRITLNTAITDRFGAALDTSYTVLFRTEPFAIKSLEIGTLENGAVFTLTSNALLDTASLLPSIHVHPSRYASGRYILSTDSTGFSFVADSTLRFGDRISVLVDTNLRDRVSHHTIRSDSLNFVVTTKREKL